MGCLRKPLFACSVALIASLLFFALLDTSNAQQSAPPRHIGVILVAFPLEGKEAQEFRHGLRDAGYVEGRDVVIEWRSANGDYERL